MFLAALSIAATLTAAGLLFANVFEDHLDLLIEQDLRNCWLELADAFALDDADKPVLTKELTDPRYQLSANGAYWRVTEDGATILRSLSTWGQDIEPTAIAHPGSTGKMSVLHNPDGSTFHVMEGEVSRDADGKSRIFRLVVALDTSAVRLLKRSFQIRTMLMLAIIGCVLVCGAWIQVALGLRPIKLLRNDIALVNEGRKARLTEEASAEVAPLVTQANRLLAQQESLVRKARERAGNLAHGLKTPLTILLGEARRAEAKGEFEIAASLREQIALMRRHIDRELTRARTFGAPAGGGALTDARKTVDRLIGLLKRMPRGQLIRWRNELPTDLRLRMDPDDFGEIVGNLLDNARKWAKSGVNVGAQMSGNNTCILIDDDGPGIPPGARDRLAQRGERACVGAEGTGLGLAIVQDILAQFGADLTIADSPKGGCRVAFTTSIVKTTKRAGDDLAAEVISDA
jgi:signal transduction histidine kinase